MSVENLKYLLVGVLVFGYMLRKTLGYLKELKTLAQESNHFLESEYELYCFKTDSAMGNLKAAIGHYQKYKILSDSIFNLEKSKQFSSLELEYETEKKDKNKLKSLSKLTDLRKHFKQFFDTLEIEKIDLKQEKLIEFQEKTMSEMAWFQFLFTLKFWIEDTSLSFEKTDIFIEKSVNTSFDLMDIAPLKSLIDFGKFMWQEKASFKM